MSLTETHMRVRDMARDFADVRLPGDALLVEVGCGSHMMMSVLDKRRVGIAALAVGIGQAGLQATKASSIAKCFASDMAVQRTADAVQVSGGSGYTRGFEVQRLYRDAKITQIYEGTNQIQRMIIARELRKKGARG
jgi:alkylation response protein AidB-like acyl-CoA dehydrogenase